MKHDPSIGNPRPRGRFYTYGPRPHRPLNLSIAFWLLLAIGGFYLLTEHRAHLVLGLPYLPFLLLAACPLLHVFGHGEHGGHGGHGGHSQHRPTNATAAPNDAEPGATESKADAAHRHGGDMP